MSDFDNTKQNEMGVNKTDDKCERKPGKKMALG
jgi:hypothetical protein